MFLDNEGGGASASPVLDNRDVSVAPAKKMSTAALKVFIAQKRNEGLTDSKIAALVGCHRTYISNHRKSMGLEATWGKTTARFTPEIDVEILRLHDEDDLRWADIGRAIPRPFSTKPGDIPLTPEEHASEQRRWCREIAERYNYLDQQRREAEEKGPIVTKTRKCLTCTNPFESTWAGHRCCGICSERNGTYGDYEDNTINNDNGQRHVPSY